MIDLYNGDCVSVLRNTIKDESIDLIVTDCPYKIIESPAITSTPT